MAKIGVMGMWSSRPHEPAAIRLYDNYVVPMARTLEGMAAPPLGKNIILVAEKAK